METKPTFEQAQLHLRVYEERREERLRRARDWFFQNYWPENFEEGMRIAAPGTEGGTNFMMVVSYWEQACALLDYGLLHEDLLFETSGEFFGVFERIRPGLQQARDMWKNQYFLIHMENAAKRFEAWSEKRSPGQIATMRRRDPAQRSQLGAARRQTEATRHPRKHANHRPFRSWRRVLGSWLDRTRPHCLPRTHA